MLCALNSPNVSVSFGMNGAKSIGSGIGMSLNISASSCWDPEYHVCTAVNDPGTLSYMPRPVGMRPPAPLSCFCNRLASDTFICEMMPEAESDPNRTRPKDL